MVLAVILLLAIANARPEWCGQLNGTVVGGCADALSRHASCSATSRRLVDTLSMSKSAAPAHRIIPPKLGDSFPDWPRQTLLCPFSDKDGK